MSDLLKLCEYPSDPGLFMLRRLRLKKELRAAESKRMVKKIAVLGGSTTADIVSALEIFLIYQGIEPRFYESEYNRFYEDVMFDNPALKEFKPDLIIIHTSCRNLINLPSLRDTQAEAEAKLEAEFERFKSLWEKIFADYGCPIIQNNFEQPPLRLMGNRDFWDFRGIGNFILNLNQKLAYYAQEHPNFYVNDLSYTAARYGLDKWHDASVWYLYKYCCALDAIPFIAHSLALIIKSLYGKNKKGFALDLDNTLWGGVVGDDGPDNLKIGKETAQGEIFSGFQQYLKAHEDLGIILNINSKNEKANALSGLNHPASVLKPSDFIVIKANWEPKSQNLVNMAEELSLLPESLVFVDDNPAEREIVRQQVPNACVPELSLPENFIKEIDRCGFFEVTNFSEDDLNRSQMYKANAGRAQARQAFTDYDDYLRSLEMSAEIKPFAPFYMERIAQLSNKTNQFNLTTRRYTQSQIEAAAAAPDKICLYGRLTDKFGDYGVVSGIIGQKDGSNLDIELFLMSCRVLKRGMEQAMFDTLVKKARNLGITTVTGYYFKTPKNGMVATLYRDLGFSLKEQRGDDSVWLLDLKDYQPRQDIIAVAE